MEQAEQAIRKRARRQRRWMIFLGLWVLAWTTLLVEAAIRYTNFKDVMAAYAVFALITSVPLLAFFGGLALFGRWIAGFKPFRAHRYVVVFAPPVALSLLLVIPSLVTRLDPVRRFENLAGITLPAGVSIARYDCLWQGIDGTVSFRISGTPEALARIEEQLQPKIGDRGGVWVACEADKSGALVVSWISY